MDYPDLTRAVLDIQYRLAEIERRFRNSNRTGTIKSEEDIDAAKGLVRVTLADKDGKPYKTGWLPWNEQSAGAAKTHFPPSKDQQVRVRSQNGDLTDGEVELSTPSDTNTRSSQRGDEYDLIKVGKTLIRVTDGGAKLIIQVGDSKLELTEGVVKATQARWEFHKA